MNFTKNFSCEEIDEDDIPEGIEGNQVQLWGIEEPEIIGGEAQVTVAVSDASKDFNFKINESYNGRQFEDENVSGEIGTEGYILVGEPDGWGVMQLEEGAREEADGSERELAWDWQENVEGGVNWMEEKRWEADLYLERFEDTYPDLDGPPSLRGHSSLDIMGIQFYNGASTSERLYAPWAHNDDAYDNAYDQYGPIEELSPDDQEDYTRFYPSSWEFEIINERNGDWNFIRNSQNYVFGHILD